MNIGRKISDNKAFSWLRNLRRGGSVAGASLNTMVWRRFRKDKMAMASLVVIVLFTLVAMLGYTITPDSTPHCNQQYLELAVQKPMSQARFLYVMKNERQEPTGFFHTMAYGQKLPYYAYPIYSYTFVADSIRVETYTGSVPNDGEIKTFHLADVAFALDDNVPIVGMNDECGFQTIDGNIHKYSVSDLQKIVEKDCLPTRTFYLGTDRYGRDVLSQIMLGSRVSLSVGFIAIAIALLIGILLGAVAAYYGGWVDSVVMWFINVVWSIPTVLLVIAITFVLGKGFWQVFVAVGLTMWVDVARVVRGQVLSIREKEYVEASKALGFTAFRTITHHILPNIWGAVIVIAASNFASAILLEAGLSFLGIGVQPPMPSWGTMVKENYGYILLDSAYLALLPGFAIMIIVLAFMLVGSGIRNALDIKNG